MDRKIYGIFVAAGSGTRMGSDTPKQFIELEGVPILQRTVRRFLDAIPELNVIIVLAPRHFDMWKRLCVAFDFNVPQIVVPGGITRFHSVQNALNRVPDDAVVLIHDGVRPFVSTGLIRDLVAASADAPAVIPVVPVVDTLRWADCHFPDPDRSKIVAVQTPQVFSAAAIKEAYGRAFDLSYTDDASVAAANGIPLTHVRGERYNIKITTPEDLEMARAIISSCSL